MATYLTGPHGAFIGSRFMPADTEFVTELPPARKWVPVDAAAHEACRKRDEAIAFAKDQALRAQMPKESPDSVVIPPDWNEMRPEQVVNLARRLGAGGKCNFVRATAHIEQVLAAREGAQMQGAA